jgi:glycine betaine/proline transport system permease protein
MATRAIPKMDVLECLPSATEIAQRRVVGKDLDFIQNMIERADALTIQAQNATDYIQLSKIIDNFQKLASRAEERSFTLKEFSKDSNPLTEINSSGQLQEKVRLLSEAIEPQITNLKLQFEANLNSQFEKYNAEIDNLSSSINSASSSGDVVALYEPIKNTINEIFENARVLNADASADTLIQRLNDVSQSYQEKADIYADAFKSDALSKINNIEQGISQLLGNVDSLNSVNSVNDHLSSLTEISRLVTSSASELNIYPESANIIININELSIATHDKITNMIDGNKILNKLEPLTNNPEELVRAVKEASFRGEVKVVEEQLMPLLDNTDNLAAKVNDLLIYFQSNGYADISIRSVNKIDKSISRIEVRYKMAESSDPNTLASSVSDLIIKTDERLEIMQSIDPETQYNLLSTSVAQVNDAVNSSDISLFFTNPISITRDVMMNSRGCVDSAFKDFTREFGGFIESVFDPLLSFLSSFEQLMLATPWPVFLLIAGALAWIGSRSYVVTFGSMFAFFAIGFLNMWEPMISTVTMISAATLLCLAIGIPMGVWMSQSNRVQSIITPILDIMQTIPSFVYLIPVVMLLGIGKVPGLIAVCIYAMPPIVRLTNLGIRLVDKEAMEAADAFGATYRQRLFSVQIPLALPNIFAGVNQTIMMALAMVVIASMIGVAGLGLPVLQAVQNQYLSLGVLNGLAIVALAIVFDRVSQAFGTRIQKHRSGDVL